jgi:hypothetical protein
MMEKLKSQLAEADAADEARKKASEGIVGPKPIGEGLVIDEWVRDECHSFHALLSSSFYVLFYKTTKKV